MKIKRNQPCPCGSNKKYKNCCLNKENLVPASDLNYRRLSKAYEDLEIKLEKFFFDQCGEEAIGDGLDEFFCWPEDDESAYIESALEHLQDLYRPWLLYDWEYDEDAEKTGAMFSNSISLAYLEKNKKKISKIEQKLILGISQKPYCFWEITAVTPGCEMTIKNIITGKQMVVIEKMMTTQVNPKNIIFTRAVMVDGIGMLVGTGRVLVPNGIKPTLIELRKGIRGDRLFVTEEDIADWDMDLRRLYLDIDRHLHTPPKLQNSDGEANASGKAGLDHDELIQIPEVRQKLGKTILDHWKSWTDIPLPALDNETPRSAVKNNDGKEAVQALLYDALSSSPDPLMREMNEKGVKHVCRELGLGFPS